ncbi:hypothetical protein AB8A21_02560 [Streptomyces sp. BF23-18]|uniref:hypothetical protein n=1 Tax=Streptomyces sp. BF23-18 TaxID=3240282 RepID=UPI0034E4A422
MKFLVGMDGHRRAVAADAKTLDLGVTGGALTTPTTLVIQGRLGPDVDPTFLEQRIGA